MHKKIELSFQTDFRHQFTQYSDEFSALENKIIEGFFHYSIQCYQKKLSKNSDWTKDEFRLLTKIGLEEGYCVFPQEYNGKIISQWLFDMVFLEADRTDNVALMHKYADIKQPFDWRKTRKLVLACESEWSIKADSILEDFYKLTFAHADLRLFVYTNQEVKYLNSSIHPAQLCREVCPMDRNFNYLLIGIPNSNTNSLRIDKLVI